MKIYNSIIELTGNTPLVRLNKIEEKYDLKNRVLVKLEMFNPSGSIKVRPAKNMILKALHDGIITKDTILIEATSGNMGIALSFVAATLNMNFIAVMPSNVSVERIKLIKAYGGEIVFTEPKYGMDGAVKKAVELADEYNGFIVSQFENADNPNAHYLTTANEILNDTEGQIDVFVSGVGTGGTISGVAKRLKEKKDVVVIGVEPADSPLLTKGYHDLHKITGIGANFIPKNLDFKMLDYIVDVTEQNALNFTKELAKEEGIFVGISSGAALAGAVEYIKEKKIKDKTIVVILPDTGERYLSLE